MEINHSKIPLIQTFGRRRNRNLCSKKLSLLENYHFLEHFTSSLFSDLCLEIGFGYGEHLIHKALTNPTILFIGAETYRNGIANLAERIKAENIENILIWPEDIRLLFTHLNPNCLKKIFILFPDPWPKKKHHKRRLINKPFLYELIFFLNPGSSVFIVTDHLEYSVWIQNVLTQVQGIHYTYNATNQLSLGIVTRYQLKANSNFYHTFIVEKLSNENNSFY